MYDFIIVGAGPAGSCLASRLAKSKGAPQVLLLEAGPSRDESDPGLLSERWMAAMKYPNSNWGYQTQSQVHANDREINYARGKGLGGSTAINMCVYTVGPRDDYDRWAEEVEDAAYNWENALRKRKNIESYDHNIRGVYAHHAKVDMATHGTTGPLRIEFPKVWEKPLVTLLEAAEEDSLGISLDINSGNPLGLSSSPTTSLNGMRMTAANAYLADLPNNLTIVTDAQVTKILFEGNKAVGVAANGQEYRTSKEIVISAGAVDSPKLLMLSGIGDREELSKLSIPSVHHLPGVGLNLEDHFFLQILLLAEAGLFNENEGSQKSEVLEEAYKQFLIDGTGLLSTYYHGLALGFFKADEVLATPEFAKLPENVKAHIKRPTVPVWEMTGHTPPFTPLADPHKNYLSIPVFLHIPQSRGTIKLASADPKDAPLVNPNFFSHAFDRVCAIAATKRALDFAATPTLKNLIAEPLLAPKSRSNEDILAFWQENGISSWHPSCTVKMGKKGDDLACLDSSFRVHGMESLRVVDMSATPFLPNCHAQSIAYFIGETAAEKMIEEYRLDG